MLKLRMILAGVICLAALCAGAAWAIVKREASPPISSASVREVRQVRASDVSALVNRLAATGIFPSARSLSANPAGTTTQSGATTGDPAGLAANAMGEAARMPPILAIAKRDGVWRLYTATSVIERDAIAVGDELYDGWIVERMAGADLVAMKGDERLEINVFSDPAEG